ncbi:MAG: hypothetical protein QOH01_778 [Verrucomicrobiota bacterium]
MIRTLLVVGLTALSLHPLTVGHLNAESPAIPPPPPPDLSLNAPTDVDPVAVIQFGNAGEVHTRSSRGHFRLTSIRPNQTVNVRLEYPVSLAGKPVTAAALDGGEATISKPNATIGPDGKTSMHFSAGGQPGLYRVLIVCRESRSLLQFWVPDPQNPRRNPPASNPTK